MTSARRHLTRVLLTLSVLLACAVPAIGATTPAAADPAIEAQVQTLSHQLRCLVCQNQSIAESNAPLAVDLRNQVRDMLHQGKTVDDVTHYLVERYGDFVLYRPPLRTSTLLLWIGPFLLLLAAIVWLVRLLRRRARQVDTPLTASQRAAARDLLSTERQP